MSTTRAAAALATASKLHSPSTTPPRGAPHREVLPRTGAALVCSAPMVGWLASMIASLPDPPVIAGWFGPSRAHDNATPDLPWLGDRHDLPIACARFNLRALVVCTAGLDEPAAADLLADLRDLRLDLRVVPGPAQLLAQTRSAAPRIEAPTAPTPPPTLNTHRNTFTAAPAIDLGELIGRHPHAIDRDAVSRALTSKRILITGAGGSIGSELALVAADFAPESIVLLERAENALFEIDRRIARRFPTVARRAILHDVVDDESTLRLLADLRPHVVFHAAAHKHVPLMEDHPGHAVTNNLFGTKSIADAAVACGAERFVMISSDKAVNPTSVMGATKRMAEMYVRALGVPRASDAGSALAATRLSMVRFGNVLGSACSVLTIWSSQIAEALAPGAAGGAPLTITDPRMTRFFMTIPEAATLVIQSMVVASASLPMSAGSAAERASPGTPAPTPVGVYVLDMADPIRILDLACRFIRAHGAAPRIDTASAAKLFGAPLAAQLSIDFPPSDSDLDRTPIDIVFTGARPGEKIHEELAYAAEMLAPTSHPGVRSWAGPGFANDDVSRVQSMVAEMATLRFSGDRAAIVSGIRRHVPEMRRSAT
ncbi:MAG: polysaccharide biosynthesis protein [Phycisphaerales bacterium]|nr:polysaccharide biosynthesis protein [Phycisphaerales bacterium]